MGDVQARKLEQLRTYLHYLAPHSGKSLDQVIEDSYEIERLLELQHRRSASRLRRLLQALRRPFGRGPTIAR